MSSSTRMPLSSSELLTMCADQLVVRSHTQAIYPNAEKYWLCQEDETSFATEIVCFTALPPEQYRILYLVKIKLKHKPLPTIERHFTYKGEDYSTYNFNVQARAVSFDGFFKQLQELHPLWSYPLPIIHTKSSNVQPIGIPADGLSPHLLLCYEVMMRDLLEYVSHECGWGLYRDRFIGFYSARVHELQRQGRYVG